jgi:hypothetical protein
MHGGARRRSELGQHRWLDVRTARFQIVGQEINANHLRPALGGV